MNTSRHTSTRSLIGLSVAALCAFGVASAASLSAATPGEPIPELQLDGAPGGTTGINLAANVATGSGALVPIMAADGQARQFAAVEDTTAASGAQVGKALDDLTFVKTATENGRKEVANARDAGPVLKQPELKRMAEMLVTDHTAANAKLAAIAERKGWPLPAPKTAPTPPTGTASEDFESKWVDDQIAGHQRSVALFRAQAESGEDADLRKFARETLPTIQHHLEELKKLRK
jgi:putative membrane protein